MARWSKPCGLCKGKHKIPCMICGWKRKDDRATNSMDEAVIRGRRSRIDFLYNLDRMSTRAHNASSGDDLIDLEIIKHREWAEEIYSRYENGESVKVIAKSEELNPSLVARVVNLMKGKLVRKELDDVQTGTVPGARRSEQRWIKPS